MRLFLHLVQQGCLIRTIIPSGFQQGVPQKVNQSQSFYEQPPHMQHTAQFSGPSQHHPWYPQPEYGVQQPLPGQQAARYPQQPYSVQQPPQDQQPSGYPQQPYSVHVNANMQ